MLDVGVVIGRFQVPKLTAGHHAVLSAANKHARLLVLIGSTNKVDDRNPLDFFLRRNMIAETYPNAIIMPLPDVPGDDKDWSAAVDKAFRYLFVSNYHVTFYGGRDSFWQSYEPYGQHKTFNNVFQVAVEAWSGSTDREQVRAGFNADNEDFRRGVIYGVSLVTQEKK